MRKSKSEYTYAVSFDNKLVVITDMCQILGGMSVTNNIENIIVEIEHEENIVSSDYTWHYYDSEGELTGFDPVNQNFYSI